MKTTGKLRKKTGGFTFVELLVVVIMVGVLAAAAVPAYQAIQKRAIRAEAIATLGVLRRAQQIHKTEHGSFYYGKVNSSATREGVQLFKALGVGDGEGRLPESAYFDEQCFQLMHNNSPYAPPTGEHYTLRVVSHPNNTAPRAATVKQFWPTNTFSYFAANTHPHIVATLDFNGELTQY